MEQNAGRDREWFSNIPRQVANRLKSTRVSELKISDHVKRPESTHTDGWMTTIGQLGHSRIELQIWFCRISGHGQRKLWAGFFSEKGRSVTSLAERSAEKLGLARRVTSSQINIPTRGYIVFKDPLLDSEFSLPILERHRDGSTYYGFYDSTQGTSARMKDDFIAQAVAFFEDVVSIGSVDQYNDVYRNEDRKKAAAHWRRERSAFLAQLCKKRDGYKCVACEINLQEIYGDLGADFAEAHHIVPLEGVGKRKHVRTKLEDLVTVCPNCHRMLHRMDGKRSDVRKLRRIVRNYKRRK